MSIERYIKDMPDTAQAIAHYIVKLEGMRTDEPSQATDLLEEAILSAYQDLQRELG